MDSCSRTSTDPRHQALLRWLADLAPEHGLILEDISPASSDASFRRYYRLATYPATQGGSVMAMDAPPEREDNPAFVHISHLLRQAGLAVPCILARDMERGFLLIEDLGRQTYYHAIGTGLDDARLQALYRQALTALVRMQTTPVDTLPVYDRERLLAELQVFAQWYAGRHLGMPLTDDEQATLTGIFSALVAHNLQAARVFVHRDFHSPNLIIRDGDNSSDDGNNGMPGIIDYQDALAGPITYDIASLVMDARTTWDEPQQLDWAIRYWEAARTAGLPVDADFARFHEAYEWMSLQRNLRILGVFARLAHRDGKHHYLPHLPRVSGYVRQVARRYDIFGPLLRILDRIEQMPVVSGYTF